MSERFALISRGLDLREEHVADAIQTREATRALLTHLAQVSAPDTGAAKVLLVYARMATTACDWLDGDLCVDLVSSAPGTIIESFTELGGGLRERLFVADLFSTPLSEFERAIARVPHLIAPLLTRVVTPKRIHLAVTDVVRRTTVPPPPIAISADSLFLRILPNVAPTILSEPPLDLPLPVVVAPSATNEAPVDRSLPSPPAPSSLPPAPSSLPPAPSSLPPAHGEPLSDLDKGWDG